MVSQPALQVSRPTPRGDVEGSGLGGSPGPHQGGKLRGLPGGLQAHTQGEVEVSGWGVSRPTPGGSPGPYLGGCVSQHALRQIPQQTATAGSTHPTGMHSCYP